jgi:rhamnulokinase
MTATRCAAVDLGAGSGRVVVAECDGERLSLREALRFETPLGPDRETGYQCWDLDAIEARVLDGLRAAAAISPVQSLGVDTWGVDYVLLDADGRRVGPAVSYRDDRTRGIMEEVFARIPAEEIYRRTGIQFLTFNTLYQLAATARRNPRWLERARHVLMVPSYLQFRLCGALANEYTDATTTQMYNIEADDWDDELLLAAGVSREKMAPVVEPGTIVGEVDAPGGGRVKVVAPGTHDTASAVAAIPLDGPDEAFISSGTWSLMGFESRVPFANATARRLNFANEGGLERRYRVLKNIMGLWLLQRIRQESGLEHATLVEAAQAAEPWRSLVDPDEARFLNPPSMTAAIRDFCAGTGQPVPQGPGDLARCAIDSLALSYRKVKDEMQTLRDRPLSRIHIVGGGCQNRLLDQLCADACGLPVSAGPVETSALGNVCSQLIALGVLGSLADARALVRQSYAVEEFLPRAAVPEAVWERFQSLARVTDPEVDRAPRTVRSPSGKGRTRS